MVAVPRLSSEKDPLLYRDRLMPGLPFGARFLIRFDDVCPTMNWAIWNDLESLLGSIGVKPIVAVVPDNRDPALVVAPAVSDFWDRVRGWKARGWSIGIHGHQHVYRTSSPG